MPRVKAIEARLSVSNVERSATFFANTRLQLEKDGREDSGPSGGATLWLDVEDLAAELGIRDPNGNSVILSEVTSDPPTCAAN